MNHPVPLAPASRPRRARRRPTARERTAGAASLAQTVRVAGTLPEDTERHCTKVRARIIRNGFVVVGTAVAASVALTEAAFRLLGTDSYHGSMIAAIAIPLVVGAPVYGWISALTLRLERSNAALDRLAHTDPLTGIANRRAAMATLTDWTTPGAPQRGCAIAIVDIDDFKCVNDRHGHDTGDAALVHAALTLERLAPLGWLVARIGGEEFLVAAPANQGGAFFAERIETMRASLAASPLVTPTGPHPLTASFGMAEWQAAEPIARLLARADRALYRAKETGRNRVEAI